MARTKLTLAQIRLAGPSYRSAIDAMVNKLADHDDALDALESGASIPGVLLAKQIFTASGTYTPTSGTKKVLVRMVGGGGGGGGCAATGGATFSMGSGGASGVYWEKLISPGVAVTGGAATVGAAGTGGIAGGSGGTQHGVDGGDTSIVINGTTYTAKGGGRGFGQSGTTATTSTVQLGGGSQNVAGSTSGADIAVGCDGETAIWINTGICIAAGNGGSSMWGVAPFRGPSINQDGLAALGPGAGGGGALSYSSGPAQAGGVGYRGQIVLLEYA